MTESTGCTQWETAKLPVHLLNAYHAGAVSLTRYANAFLLPFLTATGYFNRVERERFWSRSPLDNLAAYVRLGQFNFDLTLEAFKGSSKAIQQFYEQEMSTATLGLQKGDVTELLRFAQRLERLTAGVAYTYPEAIHNIEPEFGFHFERQPAACRVAETDRFVVYQVYPHDPKSPPSQDGKPLLIIPPYVLGADILGFLPGEKRSYAHAFVDQGIPTYIRILKNIQTESAVQTMTPEGDTRDTQYFCQVLKERHGRPVTLNGYCQGGFASLCNLLSGRLDELVDAFITCVAPMDGTRSRGLAEFLSRLPLPFNDLSYGSKILPNGNRVADGDLMGWVYKLKSIALETPLLAVWRDMLLTSRANGDASKISKTAAALNYWLINQRSDLPMEITRTSFTSYNVPITKDGILPIKLFDKALDLKRFKAMKIPWLICYGQGDDLVEPPTALAPLDHVDAEVTAFPKGHVAIATSWSYPESAWALHRRYENEGTRGPVHFQLELQNGPGANG